MEERIQTNKYFKTPYELEIWYLFNTVNNKFLVNMLDGSLMDMVFTTLGVLLSMAMLSCLCCICMKFSDLKLKSYVVEMAKKKGVKVDLDKLEPKYKPCQSPQLNENCTIMIPDVAIVL